MVESICFDIGNGGWKDFSCHWIMGSVLLNQKLISYAPTLIMLFLYMPGSKACEWLTDYEENLGASQHEDSVDGIEAIKRW